MKIAVKTKTLSSKRFSYKKAQKKVARKKRDFSRGRGFIFENNASWIICAHACTFYVHALVGARTPSV